MRTHATREHYLKQKSQSYAYFKISGDDAGKAASSLFTVYDFISNAFPFSQTKKEAAVLVLNALREQPKTFSELLEQTRVKKSTLYLLCLSLEKSGLIERTGRNAPFSLSQRFSEALRAYAAWWEKWRGALP